MAHLSSVSGVSGSGEREGRAGCGARREGVVQDLVLDGVEPLEQGREDSREEPPLPCCCACCCCCEVSLSMLVVRLLDLMTGARAWAWASGDTSGWWAALLSLSWRGMRMVSPLPSWVRTPIVDGVRRLSYAGFSPLVFISLPLPLYLPPPVLSESRSALYYLPHCVSLTVSPSLCVTVTPSLCVTVPASLRDCA